MTRLPPTQSDDHSASWAERFRSSADALEKRGPREGVDPRLHQAMLDAMRSEATVLESEERQ